MNNQTPLTDEQVVELVRSGDQEVYSEIINRYQPKLLRYATYILSDEDSAADAVQEAFISAFINLNSFNIQKKFSSWLYRIVHNKAMDILKKQNKQSPMPENIDFDSGTDLEEEFIKNEIINHAQNCLAEMDIIYKTPLSLFYLEEKSYEEISDILRIPVNTVGTRISRAKQIMKKICQKNSN